MSQLTTAEKFRANVVGFLREKVEILDDILGHTSYEDEDLDELETASGVVKHLKAHVIVDGFVAAHELWDKIKDEDPNISGRDIKKLYPQLTFDPEMLIADVKLYYKNQKDGKVSKKAPVTKEDVDNFWAYLRSFVRLALVYVIEKEGRQTRTLDVDHYVKLFGFETDKRQVLIDPRK